MIGNVLIKTTEATAIDCSHIEKITSIVIDSAEPTGTQTRYLLSVDGGKWRKYSNGAWTFADVQDLTPDSVLAEGNTKAELTALSDTALTAFAGKIIDVAVAIDVANSAEMPSVSKFDLIGANTQIKKMIAFSDVIQLSDESVGITGIDVAKTESGGGAIEVYASVQNDNNEWSDYVVSEKAPRRGKAIRIKAELEVDKPNISTAVLNNVKVHHWQSSKSAAIEGRSVLVTKPLTFDNKVNRAHAILRHPKVQDTEFNVSVILGDSSTFKDMQHIATYDRGNEVEEDYEYVNVSTDSAVSSTVTLKVEIIQNSGTVTNELLGVGNGKQQAFKLAHSAKAETLTVTGSSEWEFKDKTDTLLVTARADENIYVSYDWIAKTTYLTALACIFNS